MNEILHWGQALEKLGLGLVWEYSSGQHICCRLLEVGGKGVSLIAQWVKNPPAMRETWVQSLGWEDPLEKGKAPYSSIVAWRIPGLYSPWGHKESDTTERLSLHFTSRGSERWREEAGGGDKGSPHCHPSPRTAA